MLGTAGSVPLKVILLIGMVLLMPGAASPEVEKGVDAAFEASRPSRSRQVLMGDGEPGRGKPSFQDRFHFSTKRGIEYRQAVLLGNREFALELRGPLLKRKPGLSVRLKGKMGGYNVLLKGYGSTKKQGIKFTVDF